MGVETELKQKPVRIAELEAEATKLQQIKQAEGEAQVHVLQAKGESDAVKYTLPLKEKQIQQSGLETESTQGSDHSKCRSRGSGQDHRQQSRERTAEIAGGSRRGSHSCDGRGRCGTAI
jgi:hypothetical protein